MIRNLFSKIIVVNIVILLFFGCAREKRELSSKNDTTTVNIYSDLNSENMIARYSAVEEISKLQSEEAIHGLVEVLKDNEELVRNYAIEKLVMLGKSYEDEFIKLLKLKNRDQIVSIIIVLSKINSKKSIPYLIEFLKSNDAFIKQSAAFALGEIKAQQSIGALLVALEDSDPIVQGQSAMALGKLKYLDSVDRILNLLDTKDEYLHNSLIISLGYMKSDRRDIVRILINIMSTEDFVSRSHAMTALVRIGSEYVVEELTKLLDNEDEEVRNLVMRALWEIDSSSVMKTVNDKK